MIGTPSFGLLTSLLSGVATCVCLVFLDDQSGLPIFERTALQQRQARLWQDKAREAVLQLVPKGLRSCGFVRLGADRRAAMQCVEHAERHGLAYWVASEAQGIDSHVWVVVLKRVGSASQLLLDSYGWEGTPHRRPRFTVSQLPCEAINVNAAGQVKDSDGFGMHLPAFSCSR